MTLISISHLKGIIQYFFVWGLIIKVDLIFIKYKLVLLVFKNELTWLMIHQSFNKKISKCHQGNLHTWSCGDGEWRVRQIHTTICRLEKHPPKFSETSEVYWLCLLLTVECNTYLIYSKTSGTQSLLRPLFWSR